MTVIYPVEGGCLCGAVRYRLLAAPGFVGICHCSSCRRSAGADSVAWLTVEAGAFGLARGEIAHFASSPSVSRGFCARCGTTLTYRDRPETIDVTLASLDDPETFPPTEEVWVEQRLSWNAANPDLTQHRRDGHPG